MALTGTLALAAAAQTTGAPASSAAAVGSWDITLNDTERKCRLTLREDAAPSGGQLSIGLPPGCRRAMPVLMDVTGWNVPASGKIVLNAATGQPVLSFDSVKDGELKATGPEGETYELINAAKVVDTVPRYNVAQSSAPGQAQQAQAQRTQAQRPAAAPALRMSDIAGRYAVIRESGRDTGCMVTLSEQGRGRGMNRAQLAPACRDQGIVIFDPLGWSVERGHVVLHARKGHKLELNADGEGQWMKDGAKPLGLKRL
ncbi:MULTISPECIES: AprI/Inh family metalloprotease inhibitor [unclassified Beijerinckia]|uniref:AprI/Inh family metalloprotease inhibitor n=1 Tax=unclassified Beijerinckia TaxID=2638183 RepID=UPI001479A94D|nr:MULTISPECIES: AprI/Inh family metalloprotease inhibitor [unclassified Beijerinckia]